MSHTGTSYSGCSYFYTASVTNRILESFLFVFSTTTFIIFFRPKDPFTKKTAFFRFKSSVVKCVWLYYFAIRPFSDYIRRCNLDLYFIVIFYSFISFNFSNHFRTLLYDSLLTRNSTSKHSDFNSLTRTLNDSGIPGLGGLRPLVIALKALVLPSTSSDFKVSISSNSLEAP